MSWCLFWSPGSNRECGKLPGDGDAGAAGAAGAALAISLAVV